MVGSVILLLGPTGSGKTTQARLLAERLGVAHISSGELLTHSTNPEVKEAIASGGLVESELTETVVANALGAISAAKSVVMDGFPRELGEAKWLTGWLAEHDRAITAVIILDLSRAESDKRLQMRGRADDTASAVAEKWQWYHDQVGPVIEYYEQLGFAKTINADGTPVEVEAEIHKCLA